MKVFIGSDSMGYELKEWIKTRLPELEEIEMIDLSEAPAADFVDSAVEVSTRVLENEGAVGILFDGYGVGSFLASNKVKGMITANVTDENSARMTRDHNNAKAISIGAEVVGKGMAWALVKAYLGSSYSGGRHQIRVDMLEKML